MTTPLCSLVFHSSFYNVSRKGFTGLFRVEEVSRLGGHPAWCVRSGLERLPKHQVGYSGGGDAAQCVCDSRVCCGDLHVVHPSCSRTRSARADESIDASRLPGQTFRSADPAERPTVSFSIRGIIRLFHFKGLLGLLSMWNLRSMTFGASIYISLTLCYTRQNAREELHGGATTVAAH